jgi:hypothetical protein
MIQRNTEGVPELQKNIFIVQRNVNTEFTEAYEMPI